MPALAPCSVLAASALPALAAPGAALSCSPAVLRLRRGCGRLAGVAALGGGPLRVAARRCAAGLPASPVCRPGGALTLIWCFRPRPCEGGASSVPLSGRQVAPARRVRHINTLTHLQSTMPSTGLKMAVGENKVLDYSEMLPPGAIRNLPTTRQAKTPLSSRPHYTAAPPIPSL